MAQDFVDSVNNTLDIHSPSRVLKKTAHNVGDGFKKGIDEKKTEVMNSGVDFAKSFMSGFNDGIDLDQVYGVYGGITSATDDFLGDMKKSSNVAVSIAKGINETQKSTVETTKSNTKAKVAANNEAVKAEEDYWSRLLAVKKAGAEKEKYQDMTIEEYRKEVLQSAIDALTEYSEKLESTRDSIMNQISLFDEIEEKEIKTKEELKDNLKAQIDAYEEYIDVIKSLDNRLEGAALADYLKELGVDSLDQLREINEMSDRELTNYAMLYDEKMALATEAAVFQLSDLEQQTNAKLAEIFGGMSEVVNLYDFAAVFDGSIESITKYVDDTVTKCQSRSC